MDPSLLESICDLTRLHHLSLHWPLRSALPPCGEIPDRFSELTSLTTLQLKRVPLQRPSPVWINSFPFLQHLYWDPFLPADISGIVPFTLLSTHKLRTLHLEMRPPLRVPSSLTTLERLVLVGRGLPDHNSNIVDNNFNIGNNSNNNGAVEGDWGWLDTLTNLVSLRLQGGQLKELPVAVQRLEGLTRLGLMCNDLQSDSLPVGAWVRKLHHLHLGGNCLDEFPTALRQATALRTLFLAHQRACGSANLGARAVTQRMRLTGADVAALVNSPFLQTVVMGPQQPLVLLGRRTRDFEWLQRVLKQRNSSSSGPIRLTSNELAYTLEPLEVFAIQHLEIHENSVD